jgi:DNA-binding winged helix-turn-helix (wHTH) protein/cytochrome c-type biogenesis protein CcmH/NrfG
MNREASEAPRSLSVVHYTFGSFDFDVKLGRLSCYGVEVPLKPKTTALLRYFLEHPHRIITKTELLDTLWAGDEVIEANLAQHVFLLRQAFSTYSPGESFIVTSARQGYRFVAPVQAASIAMPKRDESWKPYVQGRFFADQRTAESLRRAITAYKRAIEIDENHAGAYAGIAQANVLSAEYLFTEPIEAFTSARKAAHRALALDPDNVEAFVSLGDIYLFYDWDFVRAYEALERASWLDPGSASSRLSKAWFLGVVGNHDGAVSEVESVLAREPFSLKAMTTLAALAIFHADFQMAIEMSEAVLTLDPSYELVKYYFAAALAFAGRYDEALELYEATENPQYPQQSLAIAAYAAGCAGYRERALELIAQIEDPGRWPYISAFNRALPRMGLRELDTAREQLREGIERRDPWSVFLLSHPVFSSVPEVQALREAIRPRSSLPGHAP